MPIYGFRKRLPITGDRLQQVIAEYAQGESLDNLRIKYDESLQNIRDAITNAGIRIRGRTEQMTITSRKKSREHKQFTNSPPGTAEPKGSLRTVGVASMGRKEYDRRYNSPRGNKRPVHKK